MEELFILFKQRHLTLIKYSYYIEYIIFYLYIFLIFKYYKICTVIY